MEKTAQERILELEQGHPVTWAELAGGGTRPIAVAAYCEELRQRIAELERRDECALSTAKTLARSLEAAEQRIAELEREEGIAP